MVVVLPHLLYEVLPAILVTGALTTKRAIFYEHVLPFLEKKKDDLRMDSRKTVLNDHQSNIVLNVHLCKRWIQKLLCVVCVAIC